MRATERTDGPPPTLHLDKRVDGHTLAVPAAKRMTAANGVGGLAARGGSHCDEPVVASERDEIPREGRERGKPRRLVRVVRSTARSEYRVSHSQLHDSRRP